MVRPSHSCLRASISRSLVFSPCIALPCPPSYLFFISFTLFLPQGSHCHGSFILFGPSCPRSSAFSVSIFFFHSIFKSLFLQNDLGYNSIHQRRILIDIIDADWEKAKLPLDGPILTKIFVIESQYNIIYLIDVIVKQNQRKRDPSKAPDGSFIFAISFLCSFLALILSLFLGRDYAEIWNDLGLSKFEPDFTGATKKGK